VTLTFATAEQASMDAFLSVSAASRYQDKLREYADSLLEKRCTKPAWCVVALQDDVPVARAALWSLPGGEVPTDLVMVDADWSDEGLSAGQAVLERVRELAGDLGADVLSHSVDSPPEAPQYQENEGARIRLLTGSGYGLVRDGLRWRYTTSSLPAEVQEHSLSYRPLPEVGEDAFVDAIASTYQGTRDSWINQTIEEQGIDGAARADFRGLQGMEFRPEWWELAYDEGGALAGVVMAARNPSAAVIAYVGVVPEQRGRGLAPHLVRWGTERLLESGADEIRGDCDRDNVGMVRAFERAGYEEFARRRTYQRSVAPR
jgi:ribosomal protein S18 acetylase RimI-like enzyme